MSSKKANDEALHAKLNAVIRLLIELNRNVNKDEFNIGSTAKMLHSIGLTPKEIANILGYESLPMLRHIFILRERGKLRVDKIIPISNWCK